MIVDLLSSINNPTILLIIVFVLIIAPISAIVHKIRGGHEGNAEEQPSRPEWNKNEHTLDEEMSQLPPLEPLNNQEKDQEEKSNLEKMCSSKRYNSRTTFVKRMVNSERENVLNNAAEALKREKKDDK